MAEWQMLQFHAPFCRLSKFANRLNRLESTFQQTVRLLSPLIEPGLDKARVDKLAFWANEAIAPTTDGIVVAKKLLAKMRAELRKGRWILGNQIEQQLHVVIHDLTNTWSGARDTKMTLNGKVSVIRRAIEKGLVLIDRANAAIAIADAPAPAAQNNPNPAPVNNANVA